MRLLERSPWGWRPGVVEDVDGGWVRVRCPGVGRLVQGGLVRLWHHLPLAGLLAPGAAVQVHERHRALAIGPSSTAGTGGAHDLLLSVAVLSGLGAPPDPVALEVWASGRAAQVVPLR